MLAVPRANAIEMCIYEGIDYGVADHYPKWFASILIDDCYVVDDVHMYMDNSLSPGDVFLRNKNKDIHYMSGLDFESKFLIAY